MAKYFKKKVTHFVLAFFIIASAKSQQQWQHWNGIVANYDINKQHSVRVSHTKSFDASKRFESLFNRSQIVYTYEPNKKVDLQIGVVRIDFPTRDSRNRLFFRAAYTTRILEKLNFTNSVRVEHNSKNENRFRQRIMLTSRIALKKRLDFLRIMPSIAYTVFYNIGGTPINYFNENNEVFERSTPDGLHRSRFTINLNSKISNTVQVNIYLLTQREFNFMASSTNKMNVMDPVRNRIVRPFNDYNVFGITTTVNINSLLNNK